VGYFLSGVNDIQVRLISVLSLRVLTRSPRHVDILSDNLPQLEVEDLRATDCHGTVPNVRTRRSSDEGRREHNLHLADTHSCGARCRDFLLGEGAKGRYDVVVSGY
jgi:hypothetical protein